MNRRGNLKLLTASIALGLGLGGNAFAQSGDTIKVGILHSLSGTMAISETVLKDTVLMAIDEINAKGGVLGKKLEPVVVDPASNWPLFAEKTKQLLGQDKVAVIFGCWTSVSRKSVLPVVEEMNGLLFYPVQYEGEELSKNVFYTGAAPNQQAIPAVDYLMSKEGGGAKRWVLLGTDYVYPRTTNKILRSYLHSKGVKDTDIDEKYTPFGHSDYQTIVADIKKFSAGGKTAVVSTINGDSNVPFYKELGNAGLKARCRHQAAGGPPGRLELLPVDQEPDQRRVQEKMGRLRQGQEAAGRRQAPDQRPDGSHLHRHQHVEAGRREGQVHRHRQGDRRHGRPEVQGAQRHHVRDGHEEPSPAQVGVHRRNQGGRPVQRGVEDARPGQGQALVAVHRRQRQEARRAGEEVRNVTTAQVTHCVIPAQVTHCVIPAQVTHCVIPAQAGTQGSLSECPGFPPPAFAGAGSAGMTGCSS
jgi:urea transport system substrate-binding protein